MLLKLHELVSGPGKIGGLLGLHLHYLAEQQLSTDSRVDTVVDADTDTSADTDAVADTDTTHTLARRTPLARRQRR